jgi:hypothetical protein
MKIRITIFLICFLSLIGYSQDYYRYNNPVSDTNSIIFADTVNNFVTDSLTHNLGFVPQNCAKLTKYFKYIGKDEISIVKCWTGDPHFICEFPKEKLIPGKIYSFEVCFYQINRPGRFNKAMGFKLSNDSLIAFRFEGSVIYDNKENYQYFGEFSEGFAPAYFMDSWIFVDYNFTKIIDIPYDCVMLPNDLSGGYYIYGFSDGLAPVKNSEGKIGFVDKNGKLKIDFRFSDTGGFSEGIAPVCIYPDCDNECWGYINTKGDWVVEPKYWSALPISCGLAGVQVNSKHGFIDVEGNLVIPLIYPAAGRFSDGLCFVTLSEIETDFFVINKEGKTVIEGPFDYYSSEFRNGKAIVRIKNKCYEIDTIGKILKELDSSDCGME